MKKENKTDLIYTELIDLRTDIDHIKGDILKLSQDLQMWMSKQKDKPAYSNYKNNKYGEKKQFTGEIRDPNSPATEPQLNALKKADYHGSLKGLTKLEASTLLSEYYKSLRKENI